MAENSGIQIETLDRLDGDAIVVGFSDGTLITYTVEELLDLRPDRKQESDLADADADAIGKG